jgi:hypothetical protein
MITLKIGDRIKCKHFVYVRDTSIGFIFDYRDYWFNEDGSWNKSVITREKMEGRIKDDPTNADAWFEVIDIEEKPGGRIHNDVVEPYYLYLLKKVGDNSHPRITIATSGIDKRSFNLELIEICKTKQE